MKIVVFTSNGIRHKYVANSLTKLTDDSLIISECNAADVNNLNVEISASISEHFKQRSETEKFYFPNQDYFEGKVLPLSYKEASTNNTYEIIKKFNPDLMIVFGSSIIRGPLLSLKPNRFINLHLGLSPYYRGSGTNFWPFVNRELEYVGSTILHLDSGIDTGDIICHVLPKIELGDNVHTVGCKVIKQSVLQLGKIIEKTKNKLELNRIKQWDVQNPKYYRNKDFNEEILKIYKKNLADGLIENFVSNSERNIKLISLD